MTILDPGSSLETRLARLEQRVADLTLLLDERVVSIREDLARYAAEASHRDDAAKERQDAENAARRSARQVLWVVAATLAASLVSAAAVILSAAH